MHRSVFRNACAAVLLAPTAWANPPAWSGGVTAVGQVATDRRLDGAATGSADLIGQLEAGTARLTLYLEAATTVRPDSVAGRVPGSNGDAGSAVDGDGRGRVQVSELKFALPLDARHVVTAGLVDPPSYVDQSRIASDENTQFLAQEFVQNPTIGFPDYTPAVVLERAALPGSAGYTVLVSGSHGLADTPGRTYAELFDVTGPGRGVFVDLAGGWITASGTARAGVWINTADHPRLDGNGVEANHGAYLVQGLETRAGRVSLRAGWANPRVARAQAYLGVAYQRAWGAWVLGAGAGGIAVSPDAPPPAADGVTAEFYLRRALADGLFLTPSLQYFRNPGLDRSGAAAERDLGVANLRLTWLW